jgi:hypothetical protein
MPSIKIAPHRPQAYRFLPFPFKKIVESEDRLSLPLVAAQLSEIIVKGITLGKTPLLL